MDYDTGIAWSDDQFLKAGTTIIGKDFLTSAVTMPGFDPFSNQVLYTFDLKRKNLVQVIDAPGRGFYWLTPSATTSAFVLSSWENVTDQVVAPYTFNKSTRNWNQQISEAVTSEYSTWSSSSPGPSYFVNTVERVSSTLEPHIHRY